MTMRDYFKLVAVVMAGSLLLTACSDETGKSAPSYKEQMLVYCGITMVHPINEIARILEPELGVQIVITQGGSEDLYQSLNTARRGDLYLPGSASYRKKHEKEGLLGDYTHVGYNQAAIMVAKGNPLQVSSQLEQLTRSDLKVVIGDPSTGSIGRETKRILDGAGLYDKVRANTIYLTTDSRNLSHAIRAREADIALNWRATAFFAENQDAIDAVDLAPEIAQPKKLLLNLLTFSSMPDKAKRFMEFAASEKGQAIFRKHGFLDNQMKTGEF